MVGGVEDTRASLPSLPILKLNVHEEAHQVVWKVQVLMVVVVINQLIQGVRLMNQVIPLMREVNYYPPLFHVRLMSKLRTQFGKLDM
jgi:hypothetical protein